MGLVTVMAGLLLKYRRKLCYRVTMTEVMLGVDYAMLSEIKLGS